MRIRASRLPRMLPTLLQVVFSADLFSFLIVPSRRRRRRAAVVPQRARRRDRARILLYYYYYLPSWYIVQYIYTVT